MKIARIVDLPELGYEVEVDDYVPFAFRQIWPCQGRPRYVRYYPDDDAPLELTLVENEPIVRSVVLLSITRSCKVSTIGLLKQTTGAPVLDIDYPPSDDRDGTFALDIPTAYTVGLGDDFLELRVGALGDADESIVSGPMTYYTSEQELVGMRCYGLTGDQMETLRWHAGRSS